METKLAKLSSSPQADEALDRMVKATNEGFTAGRLSKTDFLSWIILHFERHSFERSIEKIRAAHFDQVAYLKSIVKELESARKAGQDGDRNLAALLAPLTSAKPRVTQQQGLTRLRAEKSKHPKEA